MGKAEDGREIVGFGGKKSDSVKLGETNIAFSYMAKTAKSANPCQQMAEMSGFFKTF